MLLQGASREMPREQNVVSGSGMHKQVPAESKATTLVYDFFRSYFAILNKYSALIFQYLLSMLCLNHCSNLNLQIHFIVSKQVVDLTSKPPREDEFVVGSASLFLKQSAIFTSETMP